MLSHFLGTYSLLQCQYQFSSIYPPSPLLFYLMEHLILQYSPQGLPLLITAQLERNASSSEQQFLFVPFIDLLGTLQGLFCIILLQNEGAHDGLCSLSLLTIFSALYSHTFSSKCLQDICLYFPQCVCFFLPLTYIKQISTLNNNYKANARRNRKWNTISTWDNTSRADISPLSFLPQPRIKFGPAAEPEFSEVQKFRFIFICQGLCHPSELLKTNLKIGL